jgi:phenylalanine-4-hydroxylase
METFALKMPESNISEEELLFTEDNKIVWKIFFEQKQKFIKEYYNFILKEYIDGFYSLKFNSDKIPTLGELNLSLKTTGWQVVYVDGYLNQNHYAKFLSQKIAPISRHIRSLAHLQYAPGPDMLHDIFGHLPMLFSKDYSDFLISLANVMLQTSANASENQLYNLYIKLANLHEKLGSNNIKVKEVESKIKKIEYNINKSPSLYTLLGRFFMWALEFGILRNRDNKFQMYGAGLLSSESESIHFCKGKMKVVPFTIEATKIAYDFSSFQKQYFFSDSFDSLKESLKNLKEVCDNA